MKINKIKKLNRDKYKLILDDNNKIVTYEDVIINNNLLYKKEIDSDLLTKINEDNFFASIYSKIIRMIERKLRSKSEIIKYLESLNLQETEITFFIEKLEKSGLINDQIFVKCFINDKVYLSNTGPNKIKQELLNYQIDEMLIDEELSNIDEEIFFNKLDKYVDKKRKLNKKYSNILFNKKMYQELLLLGFEANMIELVLNKETNNNEDILAKEYNRLFNKLKEKYSGNELFLNIRKKLYQKGFTKEEIETIINNNL